MEAPLVQLEALCVPGRVSGVSFTLSRGQTLALVGPNGSGKSSVLDALLRLVPFTGRCTVTARRVAIVPQRLVIPTTLALSVTDFILLQRAKWPLSLWSSAAVRNRATEVLQAARLESVGTRPMAELSGGELRRLLVADAVERAPELLLLDEPEAGLDVEARAWLDEVLASLPARNIATLLVTHEESRAARAHARHRLGAADA